MKDKILVAKHPGIPGFCAIIFVSENDPPQLEKEFRGKHKKDIIKEVSREDGVAGIEEYLKWRKAADAEKEGAK